jgi:hypothetical protein
MVTNGIEVRGPCENCGADTGRSLGGKPLCTECEMRQLARHCARLAGVQARDALEAYLGRSAKEEEAEAFMRHYLLAVEARPE